MLALAAPRSQAGARTRLSVTDAWRRPPSVMVGACAHSDEIANVSSFNLSTGHCALDSTRYLRESPAQWHAQRRSKKAATASRLDLISSMSQALARDA